MKKKKTFISISKVVFLRMTLGIKYSMSWATETGTYGQVFRERKSTININ